MTVAINIATLSQYSKIRYFLESTLKFISFIKYHRNRSKRIILDDNIC